MYAATYINFVEFVPAGLHETKAPVHIYVLFHNIDSVTIMLLYFSFVTVSKRNLVGLNDL